MLASKPESTRPAISSAGAGRGAGSQADPLGFSFGHGAFGRTFRRGCWRHRRARNRGSLKSAGVALRHPVEVVDFLAEDESDPGRAARLAVARSAHAVVDRRRGDLAPGAWRQDEPGRTARTLVLDRSGDGSARALRRQLARHVADRGGRAQGQSRSPMSRKARSSAARRRSRASRCG
jgi:hypothetical protein